MQGTVRLPGVLRMTEPAIICPNCKLEIKLTESLAASLCSKGKLTAGAPPDVFIHVFVSEEKH
ncbi:MAG TPA: hypothetical protein VET88_00360 [Gammaproteobacteria bacterium]|nr:hypothetical protein [Gammaproteobacteria bacterium]